MYKRQVLNSPSKASEKYDRFEKSLPIKSGLLADIALPFTCLLYTSDAADERSSVDLGGRRIIKKKKKINHYGTSLLVTNTKNSTTETKDRTNEWEETTQTIR